MKIALLGSKDYDSLEFHLNDSLTFLGHTVFHIDIKDVSRLPLRYNYWLQQFFQGYDARIFKKIAKRIVDEHPELVICTYRFIHPDCIRFIKRELPNTKVVHLNPDALTTFQRQQIFVSPYDAYFTKDPFIVDFMKNKMGLKVFYLPEAFNQRIHTYNFEDRKTLEKNIDIDVVCFGTLYPYRAKMVERLVKAGIAVKLFGTADKRVSLPTINSLYQHEFITGKRKAEVLLGSKIVFNNFHYAEIQSVNAKFFEIAGMGAFQICDYKPTLEEYTGISAEKFTFKHIDEAISLIRYYLDKPLERHQLSEKQKAHFLTHHNDDIRMQEMFQLLEM